MNQKSYTRCGFWRNRNSNSVDFSQRPWIYSKNGIASACVELKRVFATRMMTTMYQPGIGKIVPTSRTTTEECLIPLGTLTNILELKLQTTHIRHFVDGAF